MVCLFLGLFYACGLMLVGLDYGAIIGLLTGLFSFIPYVGMLMGVAVGLTVAVLPVRCRRPGGHGRRRVRARPVHRGQFPHAPGGRRRIRLHEVWVIFAVLAGTALFGLIGTFLATPVAAVIAVLVRFAFERWRRSDYFREDTSLPITGLPPRIRATSILTAARAPGRRPLRPGARRRPRGSLSAVAGKLTAVPARSRRRRISAAGSGCRLRRDRDLDRLDRLRLGQMGKRSFEAEDRAQAGGGAAEDGVDGVAGAGAARADGLVGPLGDSTGLGVEDGLGERAGGVAAAAHLVGDKGGSPPVAVSQRHLEDAPGHPLELPQTLLRGQLFHLGEGGEQFLEVGLGEKCFDLGRCHAFGAREVRARHAGGEAVGGA